MTFWVYNEDVYNDWVEEHSNWMEKNTSLQVREAFENEIESLINDTDRHAFMLYHLLHLSTLDPEDEYKYIKDAYLVWDLTIPLMQAFNTIMLGLAAQCGDEDTVHAIGLANALMLKMFAPAMLGDSAE